MSNHLISLIEKNEWADIPLKITTREGHTVDTSDDQWHLPSHFLPNLIKPIHEELTHE